ncbi:MAG: adaptor protein MecA [Firmicutes bacterium]|nr:adaptor protein MecA [Bacillota bacterium]
MKIERISDSQIKFTLDRSDFMELNIDPLDMDMNIPSEKTQRTVREMVTRASEEYGDNFFDGSAISVEAVPVSLDCIDIIITKLGSMDEIRDEGLAMLARRLDGRRYKSKSVEKVIADENAPKLTKRMGKSYICAFDELSDIILLAQNLEGIFSGTSTLYMMDERYFLHIKNDGEADELSDERFEMIVYEFCGYDPMPKSTLSLLEEYGRKLLDKNALETLRK